MAKPHLHLIADMGFADCFTERIEALSLQEKNNIMLVGKKPDKRLAKKNLPYTNLKDAFTPDPAKFDRIYVHFLLPMVCHWLMKHPDVRINWVFYGADVYRNPLVQYDPIGPETKPYFFFNISDLARSIGYKLIHQRAWYKALGQVDAILWGNPIEFNLIQSLIPSCKARFEPFWYGKAAADFNIPRAAPVKKESPTLSVQLGHCAFPSVNHMDFLKNTPKRDNVSYHAPVSYGDMQYSQWLQKQTLKRKDLTWMTERLPIKEFMRHIDRMDAGVFPNIRQQGLANIQSFLLQGKPVFLHPENPSYQQLTQQGIAIGDCRNFSRSEHDRLIAAGTGNAALVLALYGEDVCNAQYVRLFG